MDVAIAINEEAKCTSILLSSYLNSIPILRSLCMKKYNKTLICKLFFLLFCCQAHADADMDFYSEKPHSLLLEKIDNKFYVEPGTVYISPSEILLNLSGNLVPIKTLFSDREGIFVLAEEILSAKANEGVWTCDWCGELNNGGNYCNTCFKLRKDKKS
jgi:hypothetical protein